MMLVALAMLVALWLLLTRTRIGLVIQSALTHPEMVESLGHNVPRVFMLVFGAGSALAGVAGVIGGTTFVTEPAMALTVGSVIFVVVVVGGMGSLAGAFVASLLIGILQTFAVALDYSLASVFRSVGISLTSDNSLLKLTISQVAPILPYLLLVLILIFRPNGLLYGNLGTGLRVSDNDFLDIDPSYPAQFNAFSPPKTFAPIGSENSEVTFVIPGSATPAAVTGFGVVFSDVDRVGAASIKLFTADGHSLGQYHAPVRTDANGFSCVGVVFDDPIVARVIISSGQAPLARGVLDVSDGGNRDLVVFDDLLFGVPHAQ
jgi:hypothetical protein